MLVHEVYASKNDSKCAKVILFKNFYEDQVLPYKSIQTCSMGYKFNKFYEEITNVAVKLELMKSHNEVIMGLINDNELSLTNDDPSNPFNFDNLKDKIIYYT